MQGVPRRTRAGWCPWVPLRRQIGNLSSCPWKLKNVEAACGAWGSWVLVQTTCRGFTGWLTSSPSDSPDDKVTCMGLAAAGARPDPQGAPGGSVVGPGGTGAAVVSCHASLAGPGHGSSRRLRAEHVKPGECACGLMSARPRCQGARGHLASRGWCARGGWPGGEGHIPLIAAYLAVRQPGRGLMPSRPLPSSGPLAGCCWARGAGESGRAP